ncbi:MAG TPA: hypothetical protein VKE98_02540 [Gemmataceae bacterium]|nr:hypothetical protein [Gemmataceae bacterium]
MDVLRLVPQIKKWAKVERLARLRPGEHVLDERVPEILLSLSSPTFVTLDNDFWDRNLCNPGYSIVLFALQDKEQLLIPRMLRNLFRIREFQSRAARMGKIIRVSRKNIAYWEFQETDLRILPWEKTKKKRK